MQNQYQTKPEPLNVDSLEAALVELLPPKNKMEDDLYAELLSDLIKLKIETLEQLRAILKKHAEYMNKADRERTAELILKEADTTAKAPDVVKRVTQGFFYSHVGLVRAALLAEYGKDVIRELEKASHLNAQKQ